SAEGSSWGRGTDAPITASRTSGQATGNRPSGSRAMRARSGAAGGVAARWAVLARVPVRPGVPVHSRVAMRSRVPVDTRGLVGLVRLMALPVLDEMRERVHQSGRLEVLLAVGLDRVDRVSQTRRVLDRRELTLHAGQGALTIHRRVSG